MPEDREKAEYPCADYKPKRKGDWIGTYSGKHFYPLDPKPEDICIADIAHALSQICRFNGHTRIMYTVANHCLNVAHYLKLWGHDEKVQLYGLLHDAAEAYIGDITRPLKNCLADTDIRSIEENIMSAVYKHFSLPNPPEHVCAAVKAADNYVLALESRKLMKNTGDWKLVETGPNDELLHYGTNSIPLFLQITELLFVVGS
jgi:hypothetical protein